MISFALGALLLPALFDIGIAASIKSRADTCNGHSELCTKSYGNVSFVGAHDSYAVGVNNIAANQDYNVTQQLNDGIRLLQVQAHNQSGTVELCHTSCDLLDGGSLLNYLTSVNTWMTANPNEVVSILIVNIDDQAVSNFGSVYVAAGVDTISYSPSTSNMTASSWPTLGELIDQGTRLVTFIDNAADLTSVSYIIDEFSNIWESAYDVTTSFDCAVNRSTGDTSTEMYLINHFLDTTLFGEPVPDVADADTTNAANGTNSLGAQVDLCTSEYGRAPNFLLVDWYEYGNGSVFEIAASINGVTYDPSTPIATPISTTTSSSSGNGVMPLQPAGMVGPLMVVFGILLGACTVS